MKNILMLVCCLLALSNAIPLTDPTKEFHTTNFNLNGPQPADEVILITNDNGESDLLKRVARQQGYGYPANGGRSPYYGRYSGRGYGGYGYGGNGYGGHHHHY